MRFNAADEEHNRAFLQSDVHAEFILTFLLNRYGVELPAEGLRVIEYTRFDDVLGAPAEEVYWNLHRFIQENGPF